MTVLLLTLTKDLTMIDNPLPDQVMRQMDADAEASRFEDYCNKQSKEWYHSYYCEHKNEVPIAVSAEDVDLINTWWDECGDLYDDYISPYEDFDPTPDGDSPYSDAEYIITPEERNRMAFESKRESHGRGNPFNW